MQSADISMADALVARLRQAAQHVVAPGEDGFDAARSVYFTGIRREPAAIVRVQDAGEIAAVLRIARDTGARVSVRNGGHSPAGHGVCDGGIVIDVRALRSLEIDAEARIARAGAGLTAGELTDAAGEHGLAIGFGDAPSVGIAGITLAGGVGFLHRRYGLTIDNLLGAEIVTADGQQLRADADTNPDLFWALRGGASNFGVVTRLDYRLHPVDQVLGGMLMLPATPETVVAFLDAALRAPDELSMMVNIALAPPMPFVPAEHHGRPMIMAVLVYAGDIEEGTRVLAPFRALATPIADMVHPMRYPEMYQHEGGPPPPSAAAIHTRFMDAVDVAAAAAILAQLGQSRAQMSVVQFRTLGGAVARVPNDATAFAHRERGFVVNVASIFGNPAEAAEHEQWTTRTARGLGAEPKGAYVAFLSEHDGDRIREVYPGGTYERLREVKRRYDPENVFSHNHNIAPATG